MRTSLPLAIGLFLAGAAQAQDLNVITGVEVKDEGNSVLVTVKGSKPPNFTTFSMADPARFVIDLSEAKFQGVPEDLRVDGLIRVVKNLAYGSGATAIARVMIAFSVDVEPPDVQIQGTSLVMKVAKPAGEAVAAAQPAAAAVPGDAAGAAGAGAGAAGEAAAAAAKAQADEEARQEALAREQIEAEAREQARLASEATAKEREAQAKAEAEAKAREAERLAAQQAAADEAARAAADARRAEIKAKAAAESAQPPKADATAQSEADAKAQREVEQALAAQQAADAAAKAAEAAPAPAPTQAQAPAPAPAPEAAAAPAQAPAPARAEPPAPEPAVVASPARPAKLQAVGFKQLPTVSRVFVKTTVPPRFTITDVGDDVVRLEVENTRSVRRNDTRPLDTSFFSSAVAMITASRKGTSYVLDIKLKKRVPYQQKVEGDVLAIDFERPPAEPSRGAAGAPGQAAPAEGETGEAALENRHGLTVSPDAKDEGAEPADDAEPAAEPQPKQ